MTRNIKDLILPQFHKFLSRKLRQVIASLGIVIAILLWGIGGAIASEGLDTLTVASPATEAAPNRPTLDTNTIPSAKVSQFVGAYLQVLRQIEGRQQELLSAPTSLESQRIEGEIESASIAAIEQAGLTKQEYLQMLSLANIDPEFGERIAAGIQEAKNQE
ncbi:DUF4168 domain-containing protein [Laspinema olomoucense]|uniref:DUF4168 domain-containing protein n=1 Tax=Laspinema olomoucense D3b TaxID=2953688 RepID=A0ABT2ND51_9CYAN|nr:MULTISPECIES: DUF4168 domain-containing protein [unclassified Laspinema]MCT7975260.1 DUF4168 domain-containing protein [Laspinema sp. D3d]MCT7980618.1 DUF4168 domain-containing protein [Laspinema sp. D3b]MCT7996123.1 DUF4168 domain-containing protein [Laspinema sp. D3c]